MSTKYLHYADLSENHSKHVANSATNWTDMLTTAARLYKYSFDEQLLIHAQKPEATACAELPIWNKPVGRYVKKGTKGIALLDDTGGKQRLRYVFDISDTAEGRYNPKTPYIWQMRPEHESLVVETLGRPFNEIPDIAAELASEYVEDNHSDILEALEQSGFDDYEAFYDTLVDSTAYMIMSRCGIDTTEFLGGDRFRHIGSFDNSKALKTLGEAASTVAENVLREIEVTIKKHDKEQARLALTERSNLHEHEHSQSTDNPDRNNVQLGGGLSDSRHRHPGGRGQSAVIDEMGHDAERLSLETPPNNLHGLENGGQAVSPLFGNRRTGERPHGTDDGTDVREEPRIGGLETVRPDGVGGRNERPQSPSGRNNQDGTDLQLTTDQPEQPEMPPTQTGGIFAGSRPLFIAIEGLDGSGKTTQARLLAEQLRAQGHSVLVTKEPSDGVTGAAIRQAIENEETENLAELFALDRAEHYNNVIAPALNSGTIVITDRYYYSSMAYQGGTLDAMRNVIDLNREFMTQERKPDMVFFLDVPPEDCMARINSARKTTTVFETVERMEAQRRLFAAAFDALAPNETPLMIAAEDLSEDEVTRLLLQSVDRHLIPDQPEQTKVPPTGGFFAGNSIDPAMSVITDDEINECLKHGSNIEHSKFRIFSYFLQEHDAGERTKFLRDEYGWGGRGRAISNLDNSYASHDSKGIKLTKGSMLEPSALVTLTWATVAKRIDNLIKDGEYMTQAELDRLPSYERQMLGAGVSRFYDYTDTPPPIPMLRSGDFWGEAKRIGDLLDNPDVRAELLLSMVDVMQETAPDHRSYESRRETLDNLKAFEKGEFTLFPNYELVAQPTQTPSVGEDEIVDTSKGINELQESAFSRRKHGRGRTDSSNENQLTLLSVFPTEESQISAIKETEEAEEAAQPVVITQEDIDDAIIAWNGEIDRKVSVYWHMTNDENARALDTAEIIRKEYRGDLEGITIIKDGATPAVVPWDKVQQRIGILMNEGQFLTPPDWDYINEMERQSAEAAAITEAMLDEMSHVKISGLPITRAIADTFRDPNDIRNDFLYARDDKGELYISNRYFVFKPEEQDIAKITEQLNQYRNADRRRKTLPPLTAVENEVILERLSNLGDLHQLDTSRSHTFKPYRDSNTENILFTNGAQYFSYNKDFVDAFGDGVNLNVENAGEYDCRKHNLVIKDDNGMAIGLILPIQTTDKLYENMAEHFPLDVPYKTQLERIRENPTNDPYIGREFFDGRNNLIVASLESVRPFGPAGGRGEDNQPEAHYLICEVRDDGTVSRGGDYVLVEHMESKIALWESNREAAEAVKAQAELQAQIEAKAKEVYEFTHGFADNLPPMQKARVLETLDKGFITNEYGNLNTKNFVEAAVKDGKAVEAEPVLKKKYQSGDYDLNAYLSEYVHNNYDKSKVWKAYSSVKPEDADSEYAVFLKDKHPYVHYLAFKDVSVLPDSFFLTEYRLITGQTANGGDIYYAINKTTYDYAKYLVDNGVLAEPPQQGAEVTAETKSGLYQAFFDRFGEDASLAAALEQAVIDSKLDMFLENVAKQNRIKRALYGVLEDTDKTEQAYQIVVVKHLLGDTPMTQSTTSLDVATADLETARSDLLSALDSIFFTQHDRNVIIALLNENAANSVISLYLSSACSGKSGVKTVPNGNDVIYSTSSDGIKLGFYKRLTTWDEIAPVVRSLGIQWKAEQEAEQAAPEQLTPIEQRIADTAPHIPPDRANDIILYQVGDSYEAYGEHADMLEARLPLVLIDDDNDPALNYVSFPVNKLEEYTDKFHEISTRNFTISTTLTDGTKDITHITHSFWDLSEWEQYIHIGSKDANGDYTEPFVVIENSESPNFAHMERLTFAEADTKFKEVEASERALREADGTTGGYHKTHGVIFYKADPSDTELSTYQFRYDIGDYHGDQSGLLNHISNFWANVQAAVRSDDPGVYTKYNQVDVDNVMRMLEVLKATEQPPAIESPVIPKNETPVYKNTLRYATDNGEREQALASLKLNSECAEAITQAIDSNTTFGSMPGTQYVDVETAIRSVTAEFGAERMAWILAGNVNYYEWDGRLSNANKEWAKGFDTTSTTVNYLKNHLTIVDSFVAKFRALEHELQAPVLEPVGEATTPIEHEPRYQGTPMWQDYQFIQDQHPGRVLFYRLGDFYEVMGKDAHAVAEALNVAVTARDVGLDERVPLVGVPAHALDGYIDRLANEGFGVVVRHNKDLVTVHDDKPPLQTITESPQLQATGESTAEPRIAELGLSGWHGVTYTKVLVVGETPARYRIEAIEPTRLAGRTGRLEPGEQALVPKTAIRFPVDEKSAQREDALEQTETQPSTADEQPPSNATSYAVGDTVYLDNDAQFIIDDINDKEVTLRDPASNPFFPSVRITPIERFEQEYFQNPKNRETLETHLNSDANISDPPMPQTWRYDPSTATPEIPELTALRADPHGAGKLLSDYGGLRTSQDKIMYKNPVLLYRHGNVYIALEDMANLASRELGVRTSVLSTQQTWTGEQNPWAWIFPASQLEQNLKRMAGAGLTPIIADLDSENRRLLRAFPLEPQTGQPTNVWQEYQKWIDGISGKHETANMSTTPQQQENVSAVTSSHNGTELEQPSSEPRYVVAPVTRVGQISSNPRKVDLLGKGESAVSYGIKDTQTGRYLKDEEERYITFATSAEAAAYADKLNKGQLSELDLVQTPTEQIGLDDLPQTAQEDEPLSVKIRRREQQERRENFRITDPHLGEGGAKVKYGYNIEAIKTLQAIESENRLATPEEQAVLSRFVGWGGLQEAFDESKPSWAREYKELQGLLSPEEYKAARASVLNAHYTSPTVIEAMYEKLADMGVSGGNILEPSMGVGNFFGMMPDSMQNAKLYGVELDSITGRIAKQLYQNADIKVMGFEKTTMPDSFFDVAVGNVPFGGFGVVDKKYDKHKFMIHDYFFAKTLDQVRPGGIVAFVTSKGTLDKANPAVRKYLAQRADLLGAVRLPNNAFLKNAGTEVTSDIIFLQKRESLRDIEPPWVHLGEVPNPSDPGKGIAVNSYFVDNPHMILGTMSTDSGTRMYGAENSSTCLPIEGADLAEQLKTALSYIEGQITPIDAGLLVNDVEGIDFLDVNDNAKAALPADPSVKNFSYTLVDNAVYYRENSIMRPVDMPAATIERVKGMVGLRDVAKELIDLQLHDGSDADIAAKQTELNRLYDVFTKKNGLINTSANARAFNEDSSYYLLASLEILDENGALDRKSDIFFKRTIKQEIEISAVDTAAEALAVSISKKGKVDMDFMAELAWSTEEKITADLQGVIFKDFGGESTRGGIVPTRSELQRYCMEAENEFEGYKQFIESRPYVTADEYLSGNVREKLEFAKAIEHTIKQRDNDSNLDWGSLSPHLTANIDALTEAQPKPLDASEIAVRLGSTWVDKEYYQQFMYELLQTPSYQQNAIQVNHSELAGEWNISGKTVPRANDVLANITFGTSRANAYKIFEDSLNLRDVRVYDTKWKDGKETRELNKKETTLAAQKQDALKEAFKEWVFKDPERRQTLVAKFNKLFNSTRTRQYDGSHIEFAGASPEINLRPHQRGAIARILYGCNTLLAHDVGAGKSFEMIGAAMESKRLGMCSKSMMVVPNHIIEDMAAEFMRLYPSANILVASKKDFEPKNRKKFCARIATGDYDCVIIGHSQFEKIPLSAERQARLLEEQIDDLTLGIAQLKAERGERFTIKQMEKSKKNLEVRLAKLTDDSRKDDVVTFEQLGINRLFVDEAHNYKNLFLVTKMRNVAGISTSEAQKSSDLFMKCRYLDEETGNKGVIFATGTPVSNSLAEMFTMQRYLQYDTLQNKGLGHFDNWASTFGETVTAVELAPEGSGYRARTRFAQFQNLPELMTMFGEVADIKTADMLDLPRPKANYHTIVAEPTDIQREMVAELSERASAVQRKEVKPEQDNMLKITSDGRKIGLDQRMINPMLPDDPQSKVNLCMENVYRIWNETAEDRLTQLVFCDFSTPNKDGRFNVYDDIRDKLTAKGVPREEMAFIHEYNTEAQKKDLFAKVRAGKVRVLFGSTAKCGSGTNVQDKLIALHDLDCPWRPADLAQRAGRIERQGNENPEVDIFRYVTDATFDSYLFQTVQKKQEFIAQIMTSKSPVRTCEDMDEQALSYAEIKALCAGNPLIAEKMGLDVEVAKLKMLRANHQSQIYRLEDDLRLKYPARIESAKSNVAGYTADAERLTTNTVKVSEGINPMRIGGYSYTERKDAGAALIEACRKIQGVGPDRVGSYRGFEMSVSFDTHFKEYRCHLKGVMTHTASLGSDPVGNITRIDNVLEKITTSLKDSEAKLETLYAQVESAKVELTKPFPQEAALAEKSARLTELDSLLSLDGRGAPTEEPREGEEQDADSVISDKVLAVKDSNNQLSGDESTPQVPPAPQPQYPTPTPPAPMINPQAATNVPVDRVAAATARMDASKEEASPAQPPIKKRSYDER